MHHRLEATEPPSEAPRQRTQRLAAVPQSEPASVSSEAVEQAPAPPVGPQLSAAQLRAEVGAANAPLSEEDQPEHQSVQLMRRAGDYDYVLVDGEPGWV